MKKMAKSTDAEVEKRVTAVYDRLLEGESRAEILRYASNQGWSVDPRSVDTYIRRARNLLKKHAQSNRELALGTARARLNRLFQKALSGNDIRGALAVQKELNALSDVYPAQLFSLKALLAGSDVPVDLAFWAALLGGLKTAGLDAAEILQLMRQKVERENADGATRAQAGG